MTTISDLALDALGWCFITGPLVYASCRAWQLWKSAPEAASARERQKMARLGEPEWDDDRWAHEIHYRLDVIALLILCFILGCALVM